MSDPGSLDKLWVRLIDNWPQLLLAAVIVLAAWLLAGLLRRLIGLVLRRTNLTTTHTQFFRSLVFWLVLILGITIAFNALGANLALSGFLAGSGVAAIVFGFAFKEIGENLLAGLFLAFSRPFEVNDLIDSESLQGEVKSIRLRHTHIRSADGRDIFIPNSQIFNKPLVNFTRDGLRRPSFRVGIDYRDDAGEACRLLAETVTNVPHVLQEPPPTASVSAFLPNHVELEVTFWVNTFTAARAQRSAGAEQDPEFVLTRSDVMIAARRALAAQGFTFSSEVTANITMGEDEAATDAG